MHSSPSITILIRLDIRRTMSNKSLLAPVNLTTGPIRVHYTTCTTCAIADTQRVYQPWPKTTTMVIQTTLLVSREVVEVICTIHDYY